MNVESAVSDSPLTPHLLAIFGCHPFTFTYLAHALACRYYLGFTRLAPVQMVFWGHPVSQGIPSIDYFISSDLFEGGGENDRYNEQVSGARRAAWRGTHPTHTRTAVPGE